MILSKYCKFQPPVVRSCWGQSRCSCACPAAPPSSPPRIQMAHPRRMPSPYDIPSVRAGNVWLPGSPSQSCSRSWLLIFSPAQREPLEEQEGPGPGRTDGHTEGTPPDERKPVKRRSEVRQICPGVMWWFSPDLGRMSEVAPLLAMQ